MFKFCLILALSHQAFAETWHLGNITYDFLPHKDGGLVNQVCVKFPQCQALKSKKSLKTADTSLGGKNPGSLFCKQRGGEVFIAFKGEVTQGFCQFNDHSIISLDGLLK